VSRLDQKFIEFLAGLQALGHLLGWLLLDVAAMHQAYEELEIGGLGHG
jgi:hypothetical protein